MTFYLGHKGKTVGSIPLSEIWLQFLGRVGTRPLATGRSQTITLENNRLFHAVVYLIGRNTSRPKSFFILSIFFTIS